MNENTGADQSLLRILDRDCKACDTLPATAIRILSQFLFYRERSLLCMDIDGKRQQGVHKRRSAQMGQFEDPERKIHNTDEA